MITSDFHMHSSFSTDSDTPMEEMVKAAIDKGLTSICFTEHNDFDFPSDPSLPPDPFLLNVDSYLYELLRVKERYADKIGIFFGIEIGLQKSCLRKNIILSKA
ncbi:MAG: PHP domain-containing protein, partial [Lachnospiraceae bacterium]|nr:PHP domain-containing protein [Lachnospiraceae bacterium]